MSVFCEMDVNCVVVWGVVGVGGSLLIHASVASLVISFSCACACAWVGMGKGKRRGSGKEKRREEGGGEKKGE